MKIKSLNIGEPEGHFWNGEKVVTSIFKKPTHNSVEVTKLGITGDTQSDKEHHGGIYKAVYAYPFEHYSTWKEILPESNFDIPAFGENLTTIGLLEKDVLIGDEYKIGSVILKVTEPRLPCNRLNIRLNNNLAVKEFSTLRFPGIYFSVIQDGNMSVDDEIELFNRDENSISVYDLNNIFLSNTGNVETIKKAFQIPYLRDKWKERFSNLLLKESK